MPLVKVPVKPRFVVRIQIPPEKNKLRSLLCLKIDREKQQLERELQMYKKMATQQRREIYQS